jgi:hypothetical protein
MSITLLLILIAATLFYLFIYFIAAKELHKRLEAREMLPFDVWLNKYYGEKKVNVELIKDILAIIAKEIRIAPTQIKPSDRFSRELSLKPYFLKIFLDEAIDTSLEIICKKYTIMGWKKSDAIKCTTIDELISSINKIYNQ